jgi:hypothetical protein
LAKVVPSAVVKMARGPVIENARSGQATRQTPAGSASRANGAQWRLPEPRGTTFWGRQAPVFGGWPSRSRFSSKK